MADSWQTSNENLGSGQRTLRRSSLSACKCLAGIVILVILAIVIIMIIVIGPESHAVHDSQPKLLHDVGACLPLCRICGRRY